MMNSYLNLNKEISFNRNVPSNNLYSRMMFAGGKMSTSTIIIIVLVILSIILALYYYYYYYVFPKLKTKYNANNEHLTNGSAGSSDKQAELLLFYAEWCPHCKTAKPNWDSIKTQYQNKTINGYHVIFTEVNCTTETADTEQMMNKYNIEGFPTIKLLKDGQIIEFDAKPTKETLNEFLNTVL